MRKLNLSAEGDNFLGEIIIPNIPEFAQEYLSHAINMIFDMNDTVLDISNIITTEMTSKFTPNKHLVHELDKPRTDTSIHKYVYAFNGEDGNETIQLIWHQFYLTIEVIANKTDYNLWEKQYYPNQTVGRFIITIIPDDCPTLKVLELCNDNDVALELLLNLRKYIHHYTKTVTTIKPEGEEDSGE